MITRFTFDLNVVDLPGVVIARRIVGGGIPVAGWNVVVLIGGWVVLLLLVPICRCALLHAPNSRPVAGPIVVDCHCDIALLNSQTSVIVDGGGCI